MPAALGFDSGNDSQETLIPPRRSLRHSKKKGISRKRLIIALGLLLLASFLSLFLIFDWMSFREDVVTAAGWVSKKVSGLWSRDGEARQGADTIFFFNPDTGKEYEGEEVNTLIALVDEKGLIHLLLYVSYSRGDGITTFYWLPEEMVGKASGGRDLRFSEPLLSAARGISDLRYMVESLTGGDLHYLLFIDLNDFLKLAEVLEFPDVVVREEMEVYNPVTGARDKFLSGQELRGRDRVLAYLLAEQDPEEYWRRVDRGETYLEELFSTISARGQGWIEEKLTREGDRWSLIPSPRGAEERAHYLAALILSWARSDRRYLRVPNIEILNGCGLPGAGYRFKDRLEARGLLVVEAGKNAKSVINGQEQNDFSHQTSIILYRDHDRLVEAFAMYLALIFNIPEVRYEEGPPENLSVIVGSDLVK